MFKKSPTKIYAPFGCDSASKTLLITSPLERK